MSNLEIYQKMMMILLRSKYQYEPNPGKITLESFYDYKFSFWSGTEYIEYYGLCGLLNHVIRNLTTAQRIRAREIFKNFGEILIGKQNVVHGKYWHFGTLSIIKARRSGYTHAVSFWGGPHVDRIYYMFNLLEHVASLEKSTFEPNNFSDYAMCACSGNYPNCEFCLNTRQCDICMNRYNINNFSTVMPLFGYKQICDTCRLRTLNF